MNNTMKFRAARLRSAYLFPALSAAALLAFSVPAAYAEVITYKVSLSGAEEVPANSTKGTGTADVTYDTATKVLSWKVTYQNLTGPATMAHIHGPAAKGSNAPVVIAFTNATSPIEGKQKLTDEQAKDLGAGKYYINVHTAEHKSGEIRGQIQK